MQVRSNVAQVATAAALFLGVAAGSVAHAETYAEKMAKPVPAKLVLVDVDTRDCFDLDDGSTGSAVRSYNSLCGQLANLMPEHRKLGLVRARVASRLFPKALDANGKRTGPVEQAHPLLDRKKFNSLNDYQVVGLAYQLGVEMR